MKKYIILTCFLIISILIVLCLFLSRSHLSELQSTPKKKIGDNTSFIGGRTYYGEQIGTTLDSKDFFVLFFTDEIGDVSCLNLDCGSEVRVVLENNGHLIAFGDRKPARVVYGLDTKKNKQGQNVFEYTLLVILSKNEKILKMYKNAKMKDIPKIIQQLKADGTI